VDNEVGERIKTIRSSKGMSQAEVAAAIGVSNSYLSHIEAGRRPLNAATRAQIARVLGVEVAQLEDGIPADQRDELQLKLRFAEMALRNGDWAIAREAFDTLAEKAQGLALERFACEAAWGSARALEATGDLEGAVAAYEELRSRPRLSPAVPRLSVLVALIRAYSECGDLSRSIDVGERALEDLAAADPEGQDVGAAAELLSTLSGCYLERGDLTRAAHLIDRAMDLAEERGSVRARAAAAWNAAVLAEMRHDVALAKVHADRAMALYAELDNVRALALLRVVSAGLLIRQDHPEPDRALAKLDQALSSLREVGTELDVSYVQTERARSLLLSGEADQARAVANEALNGTSPSNRLHRSHVFLVQGHAARLLGDSAEATRCYEAAAKQLHDFGARRQAATAWRELGEAYAELGETSSALDAFRKVSDLAGATYQPLAAGSHAAAGQPVRQ
jgi:transcriptional regulator with XRE-family HTH domain